jgi:hypothetical protein
MDTKALQQAEEFRLRDDLQRGAVPRPSDPAGSEQENWSRRNGDLYSMLFVRFIVERFGARTVPMLVRNAPDLRPAVGKDEQALYDEWLVYLQSRYA